MWTAENRERYDRRGLRYPSDVRDVECAVIEPLIPSTKRGDGGAEPVNDFETVAIAIY